MSVVPTILNPPLSAELRTEVEFFQKWGYLVIEDAITNAQIERLRLTLDQSHQRIGTQFIGATSRVTEPGESDQNWHRDGPWPVDPDGTPYGSLPGQINCGYYLDEITMENGPIVIVPGSQRALFRPPEGHPKFPDEKYVMAKPGQAILFDGWLYHRGAANTSNYNRRVCLMCYQNAWMKSRESFSGPRITKLLEEGTDEQKLLLGAIPKW